MDEKQRIKLEDMITELEQYRGRHTELVTIYAPAGANINHISSQVEQEKSTAVNIKSKSTRKNVLDALERISRHLKLFKQIPENGLAIFCGNISENEGQPKIEIWSIDPPLPLKTKLYRCDQTFLIEPLKEMLSAREVYGLVVIDRKEATIGMLEGKNIQLIRNMTSGAPGKMKAGGQCLSPDTLIMKDNGEIIEIKDSHNPLSLRSFDFKKNYFCNSKILNKWITQKKGLKIMTDRTSIISSYDHLFFVKSEDKIMEKIASDLKIGELLLMNNTDKLDYTEIVDIKKLDKSIRMIDIETKNHNFIANGLIVHNSAQRFKRVIEEIVKEFYKRVADAVKEIFFDNPRLEGILIGGPGPTKEDFLKEGELVTSLQKKVKAVKDIGYSNMVGLKELVDASKDVLAKEGITKEVEILKKFFMLLGKSPEKVAYKEIDVRKALVMGAVDKLLISKSFDKAKIRQLEEEAIRIDAEVTFISIETEEGIQFKNLGGLGAFLRFATG